MRKKRVLHILDSLCVGGMENFVIKLCNNLDPSRYDVFLLLLSNDRNVLKCKLNTQVHIVELPFKYSSIMNVFFLLLISPLISFKIRKLNVDLVHTHCYQLRLLPIQLSMVMSLKKCVSFHTIHTSGLHYSHHSIKDRIKLLIEKKMYLFLNTHVVCVSQNIYNSLANYFNSLKFFCFINNGVETNIDNYSKSSLINPDYINIVYVSRLHPGKNHELLLKSFSQLKVQIPNVRLYLLGDGELRSVLDMNIKEYGLNDITFLLGNRDDVLSILKSCQIGVFPSLYEGLSLALLEMMSVGLPIVCSDIPEFRSIFLNSNSAVFFKKDSVEDLCHSLIKVINDISLRNQLSKKSLEIVKKYSFEETLRLYSLCYDKALNK